MAQQENIFEELAPYSRLTVIPGISVGQLNFVNQQDLVYTAVTTATSGAVAANTQLQFFQGTLGDSATTAGYSAGQLSLSQTNSRFPRGQAPANQCFLAVSAGFSVTLLRDSTGTAADAIDLTKSPKAAQFYDPDDLYQIAHSFSWDLTIGRGITRTIGPIAAYCGPDNVTTLQNDTSGDASSPTNLLASAQGVGTCQLGKPGMGFTKLKVPIVFPPLVNVAINAQNGSPFTLANSGVNSYIQFRLTLRGYLMTMPV